MLFAAMNGATEVGGEKGFFKGKGKALREFQDLIKFDGTKLLAPMELKQAGGEQLSGDIELPSRPSQDKAFAPAGGGSSEPGAGAVVVRFHITTPSQMNVLSCLYMIKCTAVAVLYDSPTPLNSVRRPTGRRPLRSRELGASMPAP